MSRFVVAVRVKEQGGRHEDLDSDEAVADGCGGNGGAEYRLRFIVDVHL